MADAVNRRVVLARRPTGVPTADDFVLTVAPVPQPGAGEVLIRHDWLGLAPAARIRMSPDPHYAAPTGLGEPVYGQAIGTVMESHHPSLARGDRVMAMEGGWQEYSVARGDALTHIPAEERRPTLYLGLLGSSGFTAFLGLHDIGRIVSGERVLVSAAAGAVGSTAIQLARLHGCTVVGVAGGPEKCAHVVAELGAAACVDRAAPDFAAQLRAASGDGFDVYFDNAGGAVRDAVWPLMRDFGRIAVCGQIAAYNDSAPQPGPDWMSLLTRRLTVRGFLLRDHGDRRAAFEAAVSRAVRDGALTAREQVWDGLELAPAAFEALLSGSSVGKVLVKLRD